MKKEASDIALLSDTLNLMYSKLDSMNLILNSVISRISDMVNNYQNVGGSDLYNNVLNWQQQMNSQIAQLHEDINGLHEQYQMLMSQQASTKIEEEIK